MKPILKNKDDEYYKNYNKSMLKFIIKWLLMSLVAFGLVSVFMLSGNTPDNLGNYTLIQLKEYYSKEPFVHIFLFLLFGLILAFCWDKYYKFKNNNKSNQKTNRTKQN